MENNDFTAVAEVNNAGTGLTKAEITGLALGVATFVLYAGYLGWSFWTDRKAKKKQDKLLDAQLEMAEMQKKILEGKGEEE